MAVANNTIKYNIEFVVNKMSDTIVIDGRGHLLGRLCSIVAQQLLMGKKIVIVRCEAILISGSCMCHDVKKNRPCLIYYVSDSDEE